jgi:hypothetical protein
MAVRARFLMVGLVWIGSRRDRACRRDPRERDETQEKLNQTAPGGMAGSSGRPAFPRVSIRLGCEEEPTKYWLSILPENIEFAVLVETPVTAQDGEVRFGCGELTR